MPKVKAENVRIDEAKESNKVNRAWFLTWELTFIRVIQLDVNFKDQISSLEAIIDLFLTVINSEIPNMLSDVLG